MKKTYDTEIIKQQITDFIKTYNKFPTQKDLQKSKGFICGYSKIKESFGSIPELKRQVGWVDNETIQTTDEYIKYLESKGSLKESGCIEWLGVLRNGYGAIVYKNKMYTLHRLIYELYYKKSIGTNNVIRHLCNNKACYNIKHLQEGSEENAVDMLKYSKKVKVTEEQVKELLTDWFINEATLRSVYGGTSLFDEKWSSKLNISKSSVYSIRTGQRWLSLYSSVKESING